MIAPAVWVEAARPKTLGAAVAPVVLGGAIAGASASFHLAAFLCALFAASLIQIGTNFANDYFDFVKGADNDTRIGPRRATAAGLVSPRAMQIATVLAFAATLPFGAYLIVRGGWPIVVIGLLSLTFGVLYTGGPKPLGYLGLGDVLVFVFFGPVAVGGTVYVQSLQLSWPAIIAGVGPGLLSTAILVVNNLRDRETDAAANKRTLAVRLGARFARLQYAVCVFGAVVPAAILVALGVAPAGALVALAYLPIAWVLYRRVSVLDGPALNPLLGQTARGLLVFCILLGVGWSF